MSARELFEVWLLAEPRMPLAELLCHHPHEAAELEELARRNALAEVALGASEQPAAAPRELIGRQLGDFRLLRELGRGGMGIVFEAEQLSLHRRVAIKILPAQLTLNERAFHRFRREAEVTARLKHPHIVDIHQMGEADGISFLVMECVEGTSLDRVIERMRAESFGETPPAHGDVVAIAGVEPDPEPARGAPRTRRPTTAASKGHIESALRILCQVADALEHAHAAGVIHRDVKPSNILLRANGEAVLTDFGLAREQGLPGITGTGDFAGTPNYVSPEQAMAGRVPLDHRTDVFSLGATLYEVLTLQPPFVGRNTHETLAAILSKEPTSPALLNPALAPDLVTIVLKALEKDPDRRYPTARELAEDLRAFVEYRPIRAKRTSGVTRTLRWVRREPFKAALIGVLALGLPLAGWSIAALRGRDQEKRVLEERLAVERIPERLEDAFLAFGTGAREEAEAQFRKILEETHAVEAKAGLVMSLLAEQRAHDAMHELESLEPPTESSTVLLQLYADALRKTGDVAGAEAIEQGLPEPVEPLERFLAAVRLLGDCPYALELSALSTVPFSAGRPAGEVPSAQPQADIRLNNKVLATKAIAHLRFAISLASERAIYKFALAWACWVAWDANEAKNTAEAIEAQWKDKAVARFHAGLAREVFDDKGAREAYEDAFRMDANLRIALERKAQLQLRLGEDEEAARAFLHLVEVEPRKATYWAGLGAAQLSSDPALAEIRCDAAIERDPQLTIAYRTKARALFVLGRLDRSCDALRKALKVEPNDAILHSDLGLVLTELGELDEAEKELQTALGLDAGLPFVVNNLGLVETHKARRERGAGRRLAALELYLSAVEHFGTALELAEERPQLRFPKHMALGARGLAHEQLAQLVETEDEKQEHERRMLEDLGMAFAQASSEPKHALNLGVKLYDRGAYDACVVPLTRALECKWSVQDANLYLLSDVHFRLADALQKLGRIDDALAAAVRWSDAYPKDARAWNARAYYQVSRDTAPTNPEDALDAAYRAFEMDGSYGNLDTLALALHWSGRHAEALEKAEQAREGAQRARDEALPTIEQHVDLIRRSQP